MAKTPTKTADPASDAFVREVDEAYRQDRLSSFWERYGRWLLIATGLLLVGFAVYLWMQEQQGAEALEQAETFDAAVRGLDLGDAEARAEIERLAGSDVAGYSDIARLLAAGLALDDGDMDEAVAAFRAIAADVSVPQPLRDLATVRAARLSFDTMEPQVLVSELTPLAQPDSPWFGVAGEMLAAAYLEMGETEEAAELYAAMAGAEELPPTFRDRASQMAASLGSPDILVREAALDEPTAAPAAAAETGADE